MQTANRKRSKTHDAGTHKRCATTRPRCLEAALQYLEAGWSVIPLEPQGKKPRVNWKDYQTVPATPEEVCEWWKKWPDANVGIVTGSISDLLVIDIDGEEGEATVAQLQRTHGALSLTSTVKTGNGRHLYFTFPGVCVGSTVRALGDGVDVRAEGGYVVAPPSIHENGTPYRWSSAATQPLARLPQWVATALTSASPAVGVVGPSVEDKIYEGQRNNTLTSIAGTLRRKGCGESTILAALQAENSARCVPPLSQTELESIAQSVAEYPCATDQIPHSDLGNAKRFIAAHGAELRYSYDWGKWLVWDGQRWSIDERGQVTQLAKDTLQDLLSKAVIAVDAESRSLANHLLKSESAGHISAMVNLANTEPGIPVSLQDLDRDAWLLTVLNGTLDLRTGQLKTPDRKDLITKLASVRYDANATCPEWEKFLWCVLAGRNDLIRFVQQAIGYSLTGSTREQVLFLLYGTGANGKSTLLNTVGALLGDYAKQTGAETLLVKRGDGVPNDIARLQGARFVSAVEAEEGKALAEALVKRLTGGDKLTARFLYREHFEFEPTFKLWLGVNHKPKIRGTDNAIWRRLRVIPFTVTIPSEQRDKNLGEKLRTELPGILNWALQGCRDWQQHGLVVPKEVAGATETYREEMDVLETFLVDCTVEAPGSRVSLRALYDAYTCWCGDSGEYQINKRDFTTRLKERGREQERTGNDRFWSGIALKGYQGW